MFEIDDGQSCEIELLELPTLNNDQQNDRVIVHDIAQRLMAMELGFGAGPISVGMSFGQPCSLSTNRSKPPRMLNSSADIAAHLRKRIMVLSAGVIGEVHWFSRLPDFEIQEGHVESIYLNGVIDGSMLTDRDKIRELLIIICGIERVPCESFQLDEERKLEIFTEIYRESAIIFNSFSKKLFILASLVISEPWGDKGLDVNEGRFLELEAEAALAMEQSVMALSTEKSIIRS